MKKQRQYGRRIPLNVSKHPSGTIVIYRGSEYDIPPGWSIWIKESDNLMYLVKD